MSKYRLSDEAIMQVAKLLQIAILTGTDVIDNLRLLSLVVEDDKLKPDAEYLENFDTNIQSMIDSAEEFKES